MDSKKMLEEWSSVKKFTDEKVSDRKLEEIFRLTTKAPTAFNLQPYRFIVLESDEWKEEAVSTVIPSNRWIEYADKIVVLVGFEDIDRNSEKVHRKKIEEGKIDREKAENLEKMFEDYRERSEEFLTGWLTRNTMIPATFFMLACRSEEVGCCPVRGFSQEKLADKLCLEDTERPVLLIPIGHPRESQSEWRRNGEEIYEVR